jgi:hypothetical protein
MNQIMLASIYDHFSIYFRNVQLKVTKSSVINVDLVTFACLLKQGANHLYFKLDNNYN